MSVRERERTRGREGGREEEREEERGTVSTVPVGRDTVEYYLFLFIVTRCFF